MNRKEFTQLMNESFKHISELNRTKGKDYSGDEDALSNFKVNAERFGMTPLQTWGVYAFKHFDAIASYVRTGEVKSEPVVHRIYDAILYLFLLEGLVAEQEESRHQEWIHGTQEDDDEHLPEQSVRHCARFDSWSSGMRAQHLIERHGYTQEDLGVINWQESHWRIHASSD